MTILTAGGESRAGRGLRRSRGAAREAHSRTRTRGKQRQRGRGRPLPQICSCCKFRGAGPHVAGCWRRGVGCTEPRLPPLQRKGGLSEQGRIKRGRGANAASLPKPPRSKTKRDAKIDGCKTREKRIKNRGAKGQGEVGEGTAPKSEMQRGCGGGSGDRSRLFCRAETATPAVARPRGWGGVGTRSCGRQAGIGVPRAEAPLFSSAGPAAAAFSLYTPRLRGCPPPFHPPQEAPPPRCWPRRLHAYANLEKGIGPAPLTPLQDLEVSPLPPLQVLD